MLAARWHGRGDIQVEEISAPPPPAPGEVTLRVAWCGICGSDLEEYLHGPAVIPTAPHPLTGRQAPLTLGHEFCGTAAALGPGVSGLQVGDRVASEVILFCGQCYWCRHHQYGLCEQGGCIGLQADGGLAEYVNVPARLCFPLPAQVPLEAGALGEPLAVAVRAMRRGRVGIGDAVAIIGAGPVGLLTLQMARLCGATPIAVIEQRPHRQEPARELGASLVLDPDQAGWQQELLAITGGRGPDIVIEATGHHEVPALALQLCRRGGRALVVGIHNQPVRINALDLALHEKELIGSVAHNYDDDYGVALRLLSEGRLDPLAIVTSRIPLCNVVHDGFERLADPGNREIKVLVHP